MNTGYDTAYLEFYERSPDETVYSTSSIALARAFPVFQGIRPDPSHQYRAWNFQLGIIRAILVSACAGKFGRNDFVVPAKSMLSELTNIEANLGMFYPKSHMVSAARAAKFLMSYIAKGPNSGGLRVLADTLPSMTAQASKSWQGAIEAGRASPFQANIWLDVEIPAPIQESWSALKSGWDATDEMQFWSRWYSDLLSGRPMNWEKQRRLALIPESYWQNGASEVAKKAAEIARATNASDVTYEQLRKQSKQLVATLETTKIVGSSVSHQINNAVVEFLQAANLNQLPDALKPIEEVASRIQSICEFAQRSQSTEEIERQLTQLVNEVARLVEGLESSKEDPLGKIAKEQFVRTTVRLGTTAFWGSVIAGVSHFTGIVDLGDLLDRLSIGGGNLTADPPEILSDTKEV